MSIFNSQKINKPQDYDYIFKIVLIGDSSVGKSSILSRFADDHFSESYVTTIGVDFRFKTMIIKEKICKIQIWDTAGQERYKSITNSYYKGADAIFIIFDMNNKESLIHVDDWINEVIKLTGENILFFVGGNKFDLSNKEVSNMDIEIFKKKKKLNVFVLSAKSGFGIENAFKEIIECLVNNCEGNKDKIKRDEFSLQIEKANFEKKKRVCCGNNK